MIEYRSIKGFDAYRVGNDGSVWCCLSRGRKPRPTAVWRRLSPGRVGKRLRVTLCQHGVKSEKYVHVIVLEEFVGPCPDGLECCHNNGDGWDNRPDNLRWDTRASNVKDAVEHGAHRHQLAKLSEREVSEIKALAGTQVQRVIADRYGITQSAVSRIMTGDTWKRCNQHPPYRPEAGL